MTLYLSPHIETRLTETAHQMGLDPAALIEQIFEERFPAAPDEAAPNLSPKNAAAIAYF